MRRIIILFSLVITFFACVKTPQNSSTIQNFKLNNYLGTWYEVARLDHKFERGLNNVSANYSLKSNGTVKVINKGTKNNGKWSTAEGKAKFKFSNTVGALKVSFFGPFYGGYNIVKIDSSYQTALVVGDDLSYCWLLSRTNKINPKKMKDYLLHADSIGVDTNQFIFVKHELK